MIIDIRNYTFFIECILRCKHLKNYKQFFPTFIKSYNNEKLILSFNCFVLLLYVDVNITLKYSKIMIMITRVAFRSS